MNKTKKILLWSALIIYIIVILIVVKRKYSSVECINIEVSITNSKYNKFLEKKDIIDLLNKKQIIGHKIKHLNTNKIEQMLKSHPHIKDANVYRGTKGILKVEVTQRKAIARVINKTNISYYIDNEGMIMPLSKKYTPYVLVINGDIDESYNKWNKVNLSIKKDTVKNSIMYNLFTLAKFITDNDFWSAQIEQIYVNKNEFELIPRVGNQIVILGDISSYKKKFRNLKAMYNEGIKQLGWNNYKEINLKFKNQIILKK